MLAEEHFNLFRKFRIRAMGDKLREMIDDPAYDDMTFEDKMAELLETEASARRERKIAKLNREAGFKLPAACVEDIVYLPDRKLSRARAHADSSYFEKMDRFKTIKLLIIDDFMTTPISTQDAVDLFEIMEAREGKQATLIASQLEPEERYLRIEGELMADSILNRIATASRCLDIEGPNMREYFAKQKENKE